MKKLLIKYSVIALAWAAVLYPLWMRVSNMHWTLDTALPLNLFPLFGLAAASLLWLHVISGVFESWLRKRFDFDRFVSITASLILVCILAHPFLLIISPVVTLRDLLLHGGLYVWLGIIGWLLLITYDITKPLKKKYYFFTRHWSKILLISNIGFLITFLHSLNLGSDLQLAPLRYVWIGYGITGVFALIYTYGINRRALK